MAESPEELWDLMESAVEEVLRGPASSAGRELAGFGFVTDWAEPSLGVFLRFAEDEHADDDGELLLPVSWNYSTTAAFDEFGRALERHSERTAITPLVFRICSEVVERMRLRERLGKDVFLCLCGVHCDARLTELEAEFVRRFNTEDIYRRWKVLNT